MNLIDRNLKSRFKQSSLSVAVRNSIFILGLAHVNAQAATITVDTHLDNGDGCTLREAIVSANTSTNRNNGCAVGSDAGVDTITFSNSLISNTITLSNGQLSVGNRKNIEINASMVSGGITLDANNASRVLSVNSASLLLDNLSLTRGRGSLNGGGVLANNSTVTLNNCTIARNTVTGFSVTRGGGIHMTESTFSVNNSLIANNSANIGGGVLARLGSTLTLNNSTISRNSALANLASAIESYGTIVTFNNSTIEGNSGRTSNVAIDIDTFLGVGRLTLNNSIIADSARENCRGSATENAIVDAATIVEDGGCGAQRSGDPGLLPLANNGGMTLTHGLAPDSIAINTGDVSSCLNTDQRGFGRDSTCDVGAFEFNGIEPETQTSTFIIPLSNGKTVIFEL